MALTALIVSIVAALIAAVSAVNGWRSAGSAGRSATAAEGSRDAAERSAIAAEGSRSAAERSATASETQARLAQAAADRYEIPWHLGPAGGHTVRLTNTNRVETCFDVRVIELGNGSEPHDFPQGIDIGPGGSVDFFGVMSHMGMTDNRIEVKWRRGGRDGAEQEPWKHAGEF